MNDTASLIQRLYDSVERRKEEYMRVMGLETTDAERKISFTAAFSIVSREDVFIANLKIKGLWRFAVMC